MTFNFSDEIQQLFEEAGLDIDAVEDCAMRRAGAAFREEVEAEAVGEISDRDLGRALFMSYLMGVRGASATDSSGLGERTEMKGYTRR